MDQADKIDWEVFRLEVTTKLNKKQFELVCQLHSKYFNHRYYKPCTCSPKVIKQWIGQINDLYEQDTDDE